MYSPSEALGEILSRLRGLEDVERVPLGGAAGRVLAESAVSDLDLPPFEKSAMDGFAVHSADFASGSRARGQGLPDERVRLAVIGEARAGEPFAGRIPRGSCVAIYTGAEVPADVDAVVMVEDTEREPVGDGQQEGARAGFDGLGDVLVGGAVRAAQNVCHRGQDLALGGIVLEPGHRIRAADVSVLAAIGCDPVPVYRRPRVAILTTGDELVPPSQKPAAGQIREGNTLQLAAMTRALGVEVVREGILSDSLELLVSTFREVLGTCDALITTGGVSMGKYDLVGEAFEKVGVEPVFHKVKIKPGKPLWFGKAGDVPVFALPGNPVSCLVGHAVFVRPALGVLANDRGSLAAARGERPRARWAGQPTVQNWREQYLPVARRVSEQGALELVPVAWNGSGDVVGLSRADALARIPFDVSVATGELVEYLPLG